MVLKIDEAKYMEIIEEHHILGPVKDMPKMEVYLTTGQP